jgi:hypothetical protein
MLKQVCGSGLFILIQDEKRGLQNVCTGTLGMHQISGRIIRPFLYPVSDRIGLSGNPAGYRILKIAGNLAEYPADGVSLKKETSVKFGFIAYIIF